MLMQCVSSFLVRYLNQHHKRPNEGRTNDCLELLEGVRVSPLLNKLAERRD